MRKIPTKKKDNTKESTSGPFFFFGDLFGDLFGDGLQSNKDGFPIVYYQLREKNEISKEREE